MDRDVLYNRILGSLACACMGEEMVAPTELRSIGEIQRLWEGRVPQYLHQEMLEADGLDLEGTAARFSSLVADKAGIK